MCQPCDQKYADVPVPAPVEGQMTDVWHSPLFIIPVRRRIVEGGGGSFETAGPSSYRHMIACGYDPERVVPYIDHLTVEERRAWMESLPWESVEHIPARIVPVP